MEDQPDSGGFGARLGDAVQRWGVLFTLVVGAMVVFGGLGRTGLWDPWEMDRADPGRTLTAPAQIAVGVSASGDLRDAITAVSEELGIVPRFSVAPKRSGTKGGAAAARVTRETLSRARTTLVTAVVFEREILTPDKADEAVWRKAYETLRDVHTAVPNGRALVASSSPVDDAAWHRRLGVARLRHAWSTLEREYKLDAITWPPAADPFWETHLGDGHGLERLALVAPTEGEGVDLALRRVLAESSTSSAIVQYKDGGVTYTMPPLPHWLAAVSYSLLGTSEMSARLPGALLAFLALLALVIGAGGLFGARVATFAGLVLVTCPIFFAQARSVAGEPGAILGLTLVTVALLRHVAGQSGRAVWGWLFAGLLVGFLAKGLTAPLTYACIAGIVALVMLPAPPARLRGWAPAAALTMVFLVLLIWVETSSPEGFAGQFRFTLPIFSDGPTAYERNFDYAIKAIGFGLFPWAPLIVIGLAWAVRCANREHDATSLVLVAAFTVPTLVSMGFLKDFNHLLWPAAPVAALVLALVFERLDDVSDRAGTVMAFLVLVMGVILARELGKSPEPLAGLLAYDPPFGDKAGTRFPVGPDVKLWGAYGALPPRHPVRYLLLPGGDGPVAHGGLLPSAHALGRGALGDGYPHPLELGDSRRLRLRHRDGHDQRAGAHGRPTGLVQADLLRGDPLALLALGGLVVVVLCWLVRYGILWRWWHRTFGDGRWRTDRPALVTAGICFVVLAVHMLWAVWPTAGTGWPDGYWTNALLSVESGFVILLAGLAAWRLTAADRISAVMTALAVVGSGSAPGSCGTPWPSPRWPSAPPLLVASPGLLT